MSDDTPETSAPVVLRREALLPTERSRGLGTVAVVCTMAGVASGLALATTLMAMQVADTMSARSCPYRSIQLSSTFLGAAPVDQDGAVLIAKIQEDSPADKIGLQVEDRIISVNGDRMDSSREVFHKIGNMSPGEQPVIVIKRGKSLYEARPTLTVRPRSAY